jgi:hypothetical protein
MRPPVLTGFANVVPYSASDATLHRPRLLRRTGLDDDRRGNGHRFRVAGRCRDRHEHLLCRAHAVHTDRIELKRSHRRRRRLPDRLRAVDRIDRRHAAVGIQRRQHANAAGARSGGQPEGSRLVELERRALERKRDTI